MSAKNTKKFNTFRLLTTVALFILKIVPPIKSSTISTFTESDPQPQIVDVPGTGPGPAEAIALPLSSSPPKNPLIPPSNLQRNLQSLMGSSEVLQKFLKTRGLSSPPSDPIELNKLLSRLKPKQGRFDPALLDMLSNFDPSYSSNIPSIPSIFQPSTNSQEFPKPIIVSRRNPNPSSTEESLRPGPDKFSRVRNRFSSKFRTRNRNATGPSGTGSPNDPDYFDETDASFTLTTTESPPPAPFDHITDPNIRNHRLYDWEFETYKNFTHIDQPEDLMADESFPDAIEVRPPPSLSLEEPGWIPKNALPKPKNTRRPVSMEGAQLDSGDNDIPPDTYLKLNSESEEPSNKFRPINPPRPPRPREPLRESSTENLVFTHSLSQTSGEDRNLNRNRQRNDRRDRYRSEEEKRDKFRPSPVGPSLSPPVFIDPDQDFFTSTIRHPQTQDKSDEYDHLPNFRPPLRKLKKVRGQGRDRYRTRDNKKYFGSEEEYFKKMERDRLERNRDEKSTPSSIEDIVDRDRDPRPYPEDDRPKKYERDREDFKDLKGLTPSGDPRHPPFPELNPNRKSDRILNPGLYPSTNPDQDGLDQDGLDLHKSPQGAESRPYSFHPSMPYGPASNEMEFHRNSHEYNQQDGNGNADLYNTPYIDYHQQNYDQNNGQIQVQHQGHEIDHSPAKSTGTTDQIYAGGYDPQFGHPFAEDSHIEHYHKKDSLWSNTYFILGGLIALSAITAFAIPTLLSSMGRNGKVRNDLEELDEYLDENTSTSPTFNYNTGSGSSPSPSSALASSHPQEDPTQDSDLWTEIKGVYNDVVKIVRGDYGGVVDKLSGIKNKIPSILGDNSNSEKDGPNIVYRDEDIEEDEDDEMNEPVDFGHGLRHPKRKKKIPLKNFKNVKVFKNRMGGNKTQSYLEDDMEDSGEGDEDILEYLEEAEDKRKKKGTKTISSSINYVVENSGIPIEMETSRSRGVPTTNVVQSTNVVHNAKNMRRLEDIGNGTMATFYLGSNSLTKVNYNKNSTRSRSSKPLPLFSSPERVPVLNTSADNFMGEWARVQLIGNN